MPVFTLKLIVSAWSVIATLLRPTPKASHASQQPHQNPGAVNTARQPNDNAQTMEPACEWSIVVDDPLTGEPRGLVFFNDTLSETEAIEHASSILATARFPGLFIKPDASSPDSKEGLYLFTWYLKRCTKLGAIWASSLQDAADTMARMSERGNILCYVEPDS